MKKDSTRKRPAPLVFRLMDRFSFVLCAWNSQMAETVMALVAAVVLSPKLGQIKLAFEMPVDASPEAKM